MPRAFQHVLGKDLPHAFAVAHRGARTLAPENTLAAFARAVEIGCAMVELDVHSTRDGRIVVHHDDDLQRCTDAPRVFPGRAPWRLADFSLAELRTLDAGDARIVTRIPLLDEVLALARRNGLRIDIELKPALPQDPLLADRSIALVVDAGLQERVLISSFDPDQLRRARVLSTDIAIGLLTDVSLPDVVALLEQLDADALNPNVDDPRCVADLQAARAAGRMAFPWTCNAPDAMRRLIDAGATGVITDDPSLFVGLSGQSGLPEVPGLPGPPIRRQSTDDDHRRTDRSADSRARRRGRAPPRRV